jgi:hypothetical protein
MQDADAGKALAATIQVRFSGVYRTGPLLKKHPSYTISLSSDLTLPAEDLHTILHYASKLEV